MKRFGIVGLGRLILLFVGALALSTAIHWLRMTPEQRAQEIAAKKAQEAKDQQRAKEDAMVEAEMKRADAERKIAQKAQRRDERQNWKVQRFCEDYVQNYLLKAPSTAHFGGEAFVRMPGTNVRLGSFWVDSQNSFRRNGPDALPLFGLRLRRSLPRFESRASEMVTNTRSHMVRVNRVAASAQSAE
jgi:hypothetical protein